jgi:hypothetical protein
VWTETCPGLAPDDKLGRGPGQPSWGYNLLQGLCQPITGGKLSPSAGQESEQRGEVAFQGMS